MRRHALVFYFVVLLALIVLSVAVGWLSYRPAGICFGNCDTKRRDEFVGNFVAWTYVSAQCNDLLEQRRVLSDLSMGLAMDLAPKSNQGTANQFEQNEYYASQERLGMLTVGEMDDYLAKLRLPFNAELAVIRQNTQSFPEGFTPPDGRLIRPCAKEGFLVNQGNIFGYCEGYTYHSFSSDLQRGAESDWEGIVGYIYDHRAETLFRPMGRYRSIEERIKDAAEGVARHLAAHDRAEDQILNAPASTVDRLTESERRALVVTKGCAMLGNGQIGGS